VEKPELTVVRRRRTSDGSDGRLAVLLLASGVALAALIALLVGSDPVRYPLAARDVAERALRQALEHGSADEGVRASLVTLRASLGRRSLDSRTRVIYADLLLALTRSLDDTAAAAAHASRAAELAPVTVPVVRRASFVLARSGRSPEATALTHEMFSYDPESAADLLFRLEPMLFGRQVTAALPPDPAAWLAWARRLRLANRHDESFTIVQLANAKWPDDLTALYFVCARAVRDEDWAMLGDLLPPDREFPADRDAAPVLAYRARLKSEQEDAAGARADIRRALELGEDSTLVHILVGEAHDALGDTEDARRHWNRALFVLPKAETTKRRNVLARLARLEDRHGRAADALHLWENLLRLDPAHAEARRRVKALTTFER